MTRSRRRLLGRAATPAAALTLLDRYQRCLYELRPVKRGWLVFEVVESSAVRRLSPKGA